MLFRALSVFSLREIDVTKIESRPMRSDPLLRGELGAARPLWLPPPLGFTPCRPHANVDCPDCSFRAGRRYNYIFYVDFVGSLSSEVCQNALRHLKEFAPYLRVLGSYPLLAVEPPDESE